MDCPKHINDMMSFLEEPGPETRISDIRPEKKCNSCGKTAEKRCSYCGLAYYCNQHCQKANWKAHRPTCQQARRNVASCSNAPLVGVRTFCRLDAQWEVLKNQSGFKEALSDAWVRTKQRSFKSPFLFFALNLCYAKGKVPVSNIPDLEEVDIMKMNVRVIERDNLIKVSGVNDSNMHTVIENVSKSVEKEPNKYVAIVVANTDTPTNEFPMYVTMEEI